MSHPSVLSRPGRRRNPRFDQLKIGMWLAGACALSSAMVVAANPGLDPAMSLLLHDSALALVAVAALATAVLLTELGWASRGVVPRALPAALFVIVLVCVLRLFEVIEPQRMFTMITLSYMLLVAVTLLSEVAAILTVALGAVTLAVWAFAETLPLVDPRTDPMNVSPWLTSAGAALAAGALCRILRMRGRYVTAPTLMLTIMLSMTVIGMIAMTVSGGVRLDLAGALSATGRLLSMIVPAVLLTSVAASAPRTGRLGLPRGQDRVRRERELVRRAAEGRMLDVTFRPVLDPRSGKIVGSDMTPKMPVSGLLSGLREWRLAASRHDMLDEFVRIYLDRIWVHARWLGEDHELWIRARGGPLVSALLGREVRMMAVYRPVIVKVDQADMQPGSDTERCCQQLRADGIKVAVELDHIPSGTIACDYLKYAGTLLEELGSRQLRMLVGEHDLGAMFPGDRRLDAPISLDEIVRLVGGEDPVAQPQEHPGLSPFSRA